MNRRYVATIGPVALPGARESMMPMTVVETGPTSRIYRNDYRSAQIMNYFSNKFPRTFHSVEVLQDNYNARRILRVRFKNGHDVEVPNIEDFEDKGVLARCIMVHDLTDPIP